MYFLDQFLNFGPVILKIKFYLYIKDK